MNPVVKGAVRSKSNWLSLVSIILGYLMLPANMEILAQYIPPATLPLLSMLTGLALLVVRFYTSESLEDKGK